MRRINWRVWGLIAALSAVATGCKEMERADNSVNNFFDKASNEVFKAEQEGRVP